jgi:ataxin-10
MMLASCSKDEIVAPHQTTLLKIADTYLLGIQSSQTSHANAQLRRKDITVQLVPKFYELSTFAQTSIRRSLNVATEGRPGLDAGSSELSSATPKEETTTTLPPQELNMLLPKVCEAMVLVVQCLSTACLQEEDAGEGSMDATESRTRTSPLTRDLLLDPLSSDDNTGVLEHLVGMFGLDLIHVLLQDTDEPPTYNIRAVASSPRLLTSYHAGEDAIRRSPSAFYPYTAT